MRTVGILGGVGPETTASFYLHIISKCQNFRDVSRPNVLIQNLPIPYKVEENLLLHGKSVEEYLPYLSNYAKLLESAGADFIVMPCNTLHCFEQIIRENIKIPFISIVDVVGSFLKFSKVHNVGLIATKVTLEAQFYQNKFKEIGLDYRLPNDFEQVKIAKMIHGLVTGQYANSQRKVLVEIVENFANEGISQVLLACTDLQALVPQHPKMAIADTMQLLADEVVKQIHC